MEDNRLYTLIIHSENISGILNQIASVFTRLQVNIESLNVSASSMKNVHKFTVTCNTSSRNMDKILKQINKKLDVINASCYTDDEIFQSEIAMFKISTDEFQNWDDTSRVLRGYNTHIVEITPEYLVVELAGSGDAINSLYQELDKIHCVRQFVRSGKVAVTASTLEQVSDLLSKRKARYTNNK
ncbi:MAG TPA: acetolactate synthase small subunit [Candidatus Cryptobacteroides intestinipullorum]|nr:acetolactate synthase small subunit [Candidatus Cryptobacteroides intestinipullorum]